MGEQSVVGKRIPKLDAIDKATGRVKYIQDIKKQIMVGCQVELVDYCSLPRSERKSQRIFDNRPQ